jgi:uncharacterized protein (DUF486 family)
MPVVLLLTLSNIFMTFAWYWHLRGGAMAKPLLLIILISWGLPSSSIALPSRPTGSAMPAGGASAS